MDMKFNPAPQYKKPKEHAKNFLLPETGMDVFDPGQHFQGEEFTEDLVAEEGQRVEKQEKAKVAEEELESKKASLEKKRGLRKSAAGRKGRRASIITGGLGAKGEPSIRRASLG